LFAKNECIPTTARTLIGCALITLVALASECSRVAAGIPFQHTD
jgi:hypothetical protein